MRDGVKIISLFGKKNYREKFPSLSLLHEKNLFIECRCYDVCLPIRASSSAALNIFEETVLKLLGSFGKSVEEISSLSCLKPDFVKSICFGLRQRNFVNENNVLTATGKDYLNDRALSEDVEDKFIRVLALPDIGRLLAPILQDNTCDYDGFFDGDKLNMLIDVTNKGFEETREGLFLHVPKENLNRTRKIYAHDVKKIVDEYNLTALKKIRQANYAMSISKSGSRVFLHVKCGIQRGLVDQLIVSDGTEIISGALVEYLTEQHREYVDKFFELATISRHEESVAATSGKRDKYYKVSQSLDALEDFLKATDPDSNQINSDREKNNSNRLLAAVEHALNYSLAQRPISTEHEQLLYSQTPNENLRTLVCFARQLKLKVDGNENLLSRVDKLSFNRYRQNGVPNLFLVLPLAIVGAVENRSSPFSEIAEKNPDVLDIVTKLNRRKAFRHGTEDEQFFPDEYRQLEFETKNFIAELLPDFKPKTAPKKVSDFPEDISQERLNATVALKNSLGSKLFYEASEKLRNTLIRLSPYYKGEKMLSPMDFVNYLYMCLENYVRRRAKNFSLSTKNLPEVLSKLEAVVPLPRELKTVSQRMFAAASDGRGASLGAYVLVLFGALPKEFLSDKAGVQKIFSTVSEILSLRQHANNVELNLILTEEKLNSLREKTFDALKRMEEF